MSTGVDRDVAGQPVLGRYRIVRRLAQGGMGVVYLGRVEGAAGFAKAVVIKRIIMGAGNPSDSTARFIREAQILSNLQHPGIVGVLDFGEEDEGYSMVLEYVHGYDLGRWLKYTQLVRRPVSSEHALYITLRVLEALGHAHDFRRPDGTPAEVLHRDVSPGNILLDLEGRVRLLDFGIARMAEDAGLYKTRDGVINGKIAFLAPELFSSDPPTRSSDVYSCAVVLYQMLAGTNPFGGDNDRRVIGRVMTEMPAPLSAVRDDLPAELDGIVERALAKDPDERYPDAESFARALRACLTDDTLDIAASLRERLRADFNGDMPQRLKLEPLVERDRAWRLALGESALESTPPRTGTTQTGPEPGSATVISPPLTLPPRSRPGDVEVIPATLPRKATVSARPERRYLYALGLCVIGLAIAVGVAGTLLYSRQASPPAAQRFIVVESPKPPPPPSAEPAPARPSARSGDVSPPVVAPAAVPSAPGPRTERPPATTAASLSRAFARHNAELEACFQRHASQLEGRPEISVEFRVAPSGQVTSAKLVPSALEGTPLGQCLLRVAKDTRFGRQPRAQTFSIPIHARAVGR
ncbi:MAG TPA: protein kinase [Polyangiaceae bacterium]|nr:protein kinase [Polyangiaceae bacterium]